MSIQATPRQVARTPYTPASTIRITWLIAWRQALEAIRTRTTLIMLGFFLVLQTVLIVVSLGSSLHEVTPRSAGFVGSFMAFYLLWVAIMPSTSAIGVAAGVFAGDKERGCLVPLLASPASNTALLAGKILGAVLPALLYAAVQVAVYFLEIALLYGPDKLRYMPLSLTILILLTIPGITLLGATVASVISSRVSTFQSAQNYSSVLLTLLWFALLGLVFFVSSWGLWTFALAVLLIYALDLLFILLAAKTWRREEVMAQR